MIVCSATTKGRILTENFATDKGQYLDYLVKNLQDKLEESIVNQQQDRVFVYSLQDKVNKQALEINGLKSEILILKSHQERNTQMIQTLIEDFKEQKLEVESLSQSQDDMHFDLMQINKTQKANHNVTLKLRSSVDHRQSESQRQMEQINKDVRSLRNGIIADKSHIRELRNALQSFVNEEKELRSPPEIIVGHVTDNRGHTDRQQTTVSLEGSGGEQENPPENWDRILSKLEEKDNKIDSRLYQTQKTLRETEEGLKSQLRRMNQHVAQQSSSITRLEGMFLNLSLQMSAMQNQVLHEQKGLMKSELESLQKALANFTEQMIMIEQWKMQSQFYANVTYNNGHQIKTIMLRLKQHTDDIQAIEQLQMEQRHEANQKYLLLKSNMEDMSTHFDDIKSKLRQLNNQANTAINEIGDDYSKLETNWKVLNDRLAHVEVKVLNATLQSCMKSNKDLVQDAKLSDLEKNLQNAVSKTESLQDKVSRIDGTLFRVYKKVQEESKMVDKLMVEAENLTNHIPQILNIQKEVTNFVMHLPIDCQQISEESNQKSGNSLIKPLGSTRSVQVLCDMDQDGVYTYIQRRLDGSVDFARTWDQYKTGFGNAETEFWIGTENLHRLTTQANYSLHIELWDVYGYYWTANYDTFYIDNETNNFALHISGYHGNASDSLTYSNNIAFSTMDKDNDASSTHCAKFYTSGWWYKHCHYSNLNGRFDLGIVWFNHNLDEWMQIRKSSMKVARKG